MSPTQVADLLNRFVTQRIQREAIKNGDDLFKVMVNEPPHVKANFLKYAVAMKYADTDMAKDVLRKYVAGCADFAAFKTAVAAL